MKNKFLRLLMYLLKVNRGSIYLFFFFCNMVVAPVFSAETDVKPYEYINCSDINLVESFASNDYINEKSKQGRIISNSRTSFHIKDINSRYINYINFPYNNANNDYLFQVIRVTRANENFDGFLTCGSSANSEVICDSERLLENKVTEDSSNGACYDEYDKTENVCNSNGGCSNVTVKVKITDCETYKNYNGSKKACYPENHICNKYKDGFLNKYYSVVKEEERNVENYNRLVEAEENKKNGNKDGITIEKSRVTENKNFYILKKNINKQAKNGARKNCNFSVLSCDYKIKNEVAKYDNIAFNNDNLDSIDSRIKDYINIVTYNSDKNYDFINNIFGNLGNLAFFIKPESDKSNVISLPDSSILSKCKTQYSRYADCEKKRVNESDMDQDKCKKENISADCENDFIMRSPYYFKYVTENKQILYFVKNINSQTFGEVCSGYLPNCKYINPSNTRALYNNTTIAGGGNNINVRRAFYDGKEIKDDIKEENLYFASNNEVSKYKCLAIDGTSELNYDIGYCSDLTDDGSALKYPGGLIKDTHIMEDNRCETNNPNCTTVDGKKFDFKAPNCYLKSCIDLTAEELEEIIKYGSTSAKYCSEYYWLENDYGIKYFPKEKPSYCSDMEDINLLDCSKISESSTSFSKSICTDKEISKGSIFVIPDTEKHKHNVKDITPSSQLKYRNKNSEIKRRDIRNILNKDIQCPKKSFTKTIVVKKGNNTTETVTTNYEDYDCSGIKVEETRYYSSGGGRNERKGNCYLKSCFSMEAKERDLVVIANMLNINNELNRTKNYDECKVILEGKGYKFNEDGSLKTEGECTNADTDAGCRDCLNSISKPNVNLFKEENLSVYCDETFLKSSRIKTGMIGDEGFNDLNLNIIPCSEIEKKYSNLPSNRIINFKDLLVAYDTNANNRICRSDYASIFDENKLDIQNGSIIKSDEGSILNTVLSYSKEKDGKFTYDQNDRKGLGFFKIDSGYFFKLKYNPIDYEDSKLLYRTVNEEIDTLKIENYNGVCRNLDNNILYYNGRVPGVDKNAGLDVDYFDSNFVVNLNSLDNETKDSSTNLTEKELFLEKYVYKCKNYKSKLNNSAQTIIDCGLYSGADLTLDITSTMDPDVKKFIFRLCQAEVDSKLDEEVVSNETFNPRKDIRTDEHNWLVKPVPVDVRPETKKPKICKDKKCKPESGSKEEEGCLYYEGYNSTSIVDRKSAAAVPPNKTNYINTTNFSDPVKSDIIDPEFEKCKKRIGAKKETDTENCMITVCTRYPDDVTFGNNKVCGSREGSKYDDTCFQIGLDNEKVSFRKSFGIKKPSDRFRTKIINGDKVLVFRDSYVSVNANSNVAGTPKFDKIGKDCTGENGNEEKICDEESVKGETYSASDFWTKGWVIGLEKQLYELRDTNFLYFDATQYKLRFIASKGSFYPLLFTGIIGCEFYALGAAIFGSHGYDYYYNTCVASELFDGADATVDDYDSYFMLYMNSNRHHILDYFDLNKFPKRLNGTTDSGLIVGGNIIDNNNYLYNYYPRYSEVEKDIRSKLESNIDKDGNRYYHNTVLAKDIIKACKLERFIGDNIVQAGKCDENGENCHKEGEMGFYDNADYNFVYYQLDKNGNQIKVCETQNEIEKCLPSEILECVKAYGVDFIKHKEGVDGITDKFVMQDGAHLKKYEDCGNLFGCSKTGTFFTELFSDIGIKNRYVPTNIVAYTGNAYSDNILKTRSECQLDEYGSPLGGLSKCRGFEKDNIFYTESQAVPTPLYTHPFFFFTLMTPKNAPELFNPTFILSRYFRYSDYKYKSNGLESRFPREIDRVKDIIVDFFNPAFIFDYNFLNGVNDSRYKNEYTNTENYYDAEILTENRKSYPYNVKYRSKAMDYDQRFIYMLDKTYDIDKKGCYTPKVCIYEMVKVSEEENRDLCVNDIPLSKGKGIMELGTNPKECFKIIDSDVACYDRNIPFIDQFILKLDESSIFYNTPYINVYLKPNNPYQANDFNFIKKNSSSYVMKENDPSNIVEIDSSFENNIEGIGNRVVSRAFSEIQNFGLNFERSYCSQLYYDYYTSLDTVKRSESGIGNNNIASINRLKTKINNINTIIRPDCDKENGEEGEYIIEEGTALRDIPENERNCRTQCGAGGTNCYEQCDTSKVISRKTAIVKKYNESYGGFNEICVADADIKNIISVYNSQQLYDSNNLSKYSLPKVYAFKDNNGRGRKTKCLLNSSSRGNPKCLVANEVYVYCSQEEKGGDECREPKLNIRTLKTDYIKKINCKELFDNNEITREVTADNIEKIKICYKGGFNGSGNIYTREGDVDDSCSCEETGKNAIIPEGYFTIREITPREYGLCVNLITPEICPAIRYYDDTKKYTDDNLILGLTEDEVKSKDLKDYRQHLWRTDEKIIGKIPNVLFSKTLGHAEFDEGVYCNSVDEETVRSILKTTELNVYSYEEIEKIMNSKDEDVRALENATNDCKDKLNKTECINSYLLREYNDDQDRVDEIVENKWNKIYKEFEEEFKDITEVDTKEFKIRATLENEKYKYSDEEIEDIMSKKDSRYTDIKNKYYDKSCVGGSNLTLGECNGFWRYAGNDGKTAPTAICEVKYDRNGDKVYEYELVGSGCERYVCGNIAYDDQKGLIGDEKEMLANVFEQSEVDSYRGAVKLTDYRSRIHNEEKDAATVDKRGSVNGFAAWKKVTSGDYATVEIAYDCLTGYSPAGFNYYMNSDITDGEKVVSTSNNESVNDINYDTYDTLSAISSDIDITEIENFRRYISGQNEIFEKAKKDKYIPLLKSESLLSESLLGYPNRRCNQKGEWMIVNDVYNLHSIDPNELNNNYYYNNYSRKTSYNSNNGGDNENLKKLNSWLRLYNTNLELNTTINNTNGLNTSFGGYCERNICFAINPVNENIYDKEVLNRTDSSTEAALKPYFWKHSGGASWDNLGAPRNSSGKISTSISGNDNVTKNIYYIFTDQVDELNSIEDKYLKKAYGECRTDYGYYNRGTIFKGGEGSNGATFDGQLTELKNGEKSNNTGLVDQRKYDFISNFEYSTKPERICTSYGLWGPVFNRCFRGCEMLDIYHTNYTEEAANRLYKTSKDDPIYGKSRKSNFVQDKNYFIENNDIATTTIRDDDRSKEGFMEKKFKEELGLFDSPDRYLNGTSALQGVSETERKKGITVADYITGGASWPRTIIDVDNAKIDNEDGSSKQGLRYVEVESDCDQTFGTNDNRIRQFAVRAAGVRPKRRCYEDGSWGQVYEYTRCVLQKTCETFKFSLYDLILLEKIYREEVTNPDLLADLNKVLAKEITFGFYDGNYENATKLNNSDKPCNNYRDVKNCFIYNFRAANFVGGASESIETNSPVAASGFTDGYTDGLICNSTGIGGSSTTNSGWSLKESDIGEYFKPYVCDENSANSYDNTMNSESISLRELYENKIILNTDTSYKKEGTINHYVKESKLHFMYNNLHLNSNGLFDGYNFIRGIVDNNAQTIYASGTTGNALENETIKSVSIGIKKYRSYQMLFKCDDEYFYNIIDKGNVNPIANSAVTNSTTSNNEKKSDDRTSITLQSYGTGIKYFNHNIVLECRLDDGGTSGIFKQHANTNTNSNDPNQKPLDPSKCHVKTCGDNEYQRRWSLGIIKEARDKFGDEGLKLTKVSIDSSGSSKTDSTKPTQSFIGCPMVCNNDGSKICTTNNDCNDRGECTIKTAFVVNDNDILKDYIEYYQEELKEGKGDGQEKENERIKERNKDYIARKYITKITTDCLNNIGATKINEMEAGGVGTYDLQRYGKLDYNKVPKKFCRDLDKKECIGTAPEKNLMSGLIDKPDGVILKNSEGKLDNTAKYVFLNAPKEEGGFCVPMACRGEKLKFFIDEEDKKGKVKECTDQEVEDGECFNLNSTYYSFGEVVVVQNVSNDFTKDYLTANLSVSYSSVQNNIHTITTKSDSGIKVNDNLKNLCGPDTDVYTKTAAGFYDYDAYIEIIKKKEPNEEETVNNCFNKLDNHNSIIKTTVINDCSGNNASKDYCIYKNIGYVDIGNGVMVKYGSGDNNKTVLEELKSKKSSFNATLTDEEKKEAGKLAVEALITNPNYGGETNTNGLAYKYIYKDADTNNITNARTKAEEALKAATGSNKKCYHSTNTAANTAGGGLAVGGGDTDKAKNYGTKSGKTSGVTFYTNSDKSFVGITFNESCTITYEVQDSSGNKSNTTASGIAVYDVSVYNTSYDTNLISNKTASINTQKDTLAGTISKTSDTNLKKVYDRQESIFKMKKFLSQQSIITDNEGNALDLLAVYNQYLANIKNVDYSLALTDKAVALVKQVGDTSDGKNEIISEDDSSTETTTFTGKVFIYYLDDKSSASGKCVHVTGLADVQIGNIINGDTSIATTTCSYKTDELNFDKEMEAARSIGENVFNFLTTNDIGEEIEKYDNTQQVCYAKYKDFFAKKPDDSKTTESFRSGLYLAMTCTPTGWQVHGTASCKQRCTGASFAATRVNPYNLELTTEGRYYRLKVKNLRYTKSVKALMGGVINSCEFNSSGSTSYGEIEVKCTDNTLTNEGTLLKTSIIATNKGGGIPTWHKFYKFPAYRKSYRSSHSFSDGGSKSCYKEWKHSSYEFHACIQEGSGSKGKGTLGPATSDNGITNLWICTANEDDINHNSGECPYEGTYHTVFDGKNYVEKSTTCIDGSVNIRWYDYFLSFKAKKRKDEKVKHCYY